MPSYQESIETLVNVVVKTNGVDRARTHILPLITAVVNGETVISEKRIQLYISIDHSMESDYIRICWEDYGYENYRDMGLYGEMAPKFQPCIDLGQQTFKIQDDHYEIYINYANCVHES